MFYDPKCLLEAMFPVSSQNITSNIISIDIKSVITPYKLLTLNVMNVVVSFSLQFLLSLVLFSFGDGMKYFSGEEIHFFAPSFRQTDICVES